MSKTIVVTGGATGIGAATVSRLLKQNCEIIILDVATPKDSPAHYIYCDLSVPQSIDEAIKQLPGQLDSLINVAGVSGSHPGALVIAINFLGLRQITETLLPRLGNGSVVNVASSAGRDWQNRATEVNGLLDTSDFESGLTWVRDNEHTWVDNPYKFSKQCAAAYTHKATAIGLPHQVRVNCVNPGVVGTQLTTEFRDLLGDEVYDGVVAEIGREGTPDDIADVIEFLSIGHCPWLNGVEIAVDGGYLSGITGGWIQPAAKPR